MSDMTLHTIALERHSALATTKPLSGREIEMRAIDGSTILQLLAGHSSPTASEIEEALAAHGPFSLRETGPGQWLAVSDDTLTPDQIKTVAEAIKSAHDLDCVDQSHGRARIFIAGKAVRDVLAKGTAVDLDPTRFAIGSSTMTLIGHIGANLTRVDEDHFELLPLRGFAESLWHDLTIMARA